MARSPAENLYDLLLPSVRMRIHAYADHGFLPLTSWPTIIDRSNEWLRQWIPNHLDDFRNCWREAVDAWLDTQVYDPTSSANA